MKNKFDKEFGTEFQSPKNLDFDKWYIRKKDLKLKVDEAFFVLTVLNFVQTTTRDGTSRQRKSRKNKFVVPVSKKRNPGTTFSLSNLTRYKNFGSRRAKIGGNLLFVVLSFLEKSQAILSLNL